MSTTIENLGKLVNALEASVDEVAKVAENVTLQTIDLKPRAYPFLNEIARKLIDIHIPSIEYTHEADGYKIKTECLFATKMVPVNAEGGIDDIYIEKWAKMLNFLADNQIWDHGVLAAFGAIKLVQYGDGSGKLSQYKEPITSTKFGIFSFLHTSHMTPYSVGMEFGGPTIKQIGTIAYNKKLNDFVGWDVFGDEGHIGDIDWSTCPF